MSDSSRRRPSPLFPVCLRVTPTAEAEYFLARAEDAVALKLRAKAVAKAYAAQGARSGAVLPYTSALGGLAVPVAAALVEMVPLVHSSPLVLALVFAAFPLAGAAGEKHGQKSNKQPILLYSHLSLYALFTLVFSPFLSLSLSLFLLRRAHLLFQWPAPPSSPRRAAK
jgi:hypothetical protein